MAHELPSTQGMTSHADCPGCAGCAVFRERVRFIINGVDITESVETADEPIFVPPERLITPEQTDEINQFLREHQDAIEDAIARRMLQYALFGFAPADLIVHPEPPAGRWIPFSEATDLRVREHRSIHPVEPEQPSAETFHAHRRKVLERMFYAAPAHGDSMRGLMDLPPCPHCEGHCVEDDRFFDADPVDTLIDETDDLDRRIAEALGA